MERGENMKTKRLDIPLKGAREYLHGPDLFDASFDTLITDKHEAYDTFEISFHRMARKQVDLVWDIDKAPQDAVALGRLSRTGGALLHFWICEQNEPLTKRTTCPEEEIVTELKFADDFSNARLEEKPSHTLMETWVPMIKAMHQRRFADADGKWMFARAKTWAYEPQQTPSALRVELLATLGTKLTRNGVFADGKLVGDVFFVLM